VWSWQRERGSVSNPRTLHKSWLRGTIRNKSRDGLCRNAAGDPDGQADANVVPTLGLHDPRRLTTVLPSGSAREPCLSSGPPPRTRGEARTRQGRGRKRRATAWTAEADHGSAGGSLVKPRDGARSRAGIESPTCSSCIRGRVAPRARVPLERLGARAIGSRRVRAHHRAGERSALGAKDGGGGMGEAQGRLAHSLALTLATRMRPPEPSGR
jgi:hypothetical protein